MNKYRERVPQTEFEKYAELLQALKRSIGRFRVAAESESTTISEVHKATIEESFKIVTSLEHAISSKKKIPADWVDAGLSDDTAFTKIAIPHSFNADGSVQFQKSIETDNPREFLRMIAASEDEDTQETSHATTTETTPSAMDLVRARMPQRTTEPTFKSSSHVTEPKKANGSLFGKYKK